MSLWTILYEILRITRLFLIHVLIMAINEVLVTALLHYGIVYFLLIFAIREPYTHLKQNSAMLQFLSRGVHVKQSGVLFIILTK